MNLRSVLFFIACFCSEIIFSQRSELVDSTLKIKISQIDDVVQLKAKLRKNGYPFISMDTLIASDSIVLYNVNRNVFVKDIDLKIYKQYINDTVVHDFPIFNDYIDIQTKVDNEFNELIRQGYLKSNYSIDTFFIHKDRFSILYTMNANKRIQIDSIRVWNSNVMNNSFLNQILKNTIKKNKYDFKSIIDQVRTIQFIEFQKNPDFTLRDTTAILNLYLKERKLNQFNAVLGLLTDGYGTNSVQITGDVQLSLFNLLKRGINLELNWQKKLLNSQFLYLKTSIPYLFNTNLGLSANMNIEKFDTSYLRVLLQLNLDYYIASNQIISLVYKNQFSTINGLNIQSVQSGILPKYLDYKLNQFGFSYKLNQLTKPFFNKNGLRLESNFLLGYKQIDINQTIANLKDNQGNSLARLYDSINKNQIVITYYLDIIKYTRLWNNLVLKNQIESKLFLASDIRQNEMYYFGGINKPRGFDDNSLISPQYVSLYSDFQYYLTEYFYSNIFADVSIMKNSLDNKINYPIGLGLGFALQTKGSIFQMNIGTGQLNNQTFSISNSKLHIQYINVF